LSQRDWLEVKEKFEKKQQNFFQIFLDSDEIFYPSDNFKNIFNSKNNFIYAKDLKKEKPGKWIPVYNKKNVPIFFIKNKIYPIRSGQAAFFFYKGEIFLELSNIKFEEIDKKRVKPIEDFIPESLNVKFQRNENVYLNKAVALGIINHFVSIYNNLNKKYSRLLYGQFGKIKLTKELRFQTSKGYKIIEPGFQFEIDLVLENKEEIFIIEAKLGTKERENFSLLQLYYPYIYFKSLIKNKPIRTIFIDIIETKKEEYYKFIEIEFKNGLFDKVKITKTFKYI
jgi:hypothetical protein